MNWINKADTVEDKDGGLLLKGFSDPEVREKHKFTSKIDKLLDGNDPGEDKGFMIETVRKNMIENMTANAKHVKDQWNSDKITPQMQDELNEYLDLQNDKETLMMLVYEKMLQHSDWRKQYKAIYSNANEILRAIGPILLDYPHSDDDVFATIINNTVRRYLASCASSVLAHICMAKKHKIPLDLVVPTLRRLAMLDLMDERIEVCEDWKKFLKELEQVGENAEQKKGEKAKIQKLTADEIIQERTGIWRKARASLIYYKKKEAAKPPDGFAYFAKCCVYDCSNFETPDKRHSIRCQKCWYYHCCSPACDSYAQKIGLHRCDVVKGKDAQAVRKQTQVALRALCNYCGSLQDNVSDEALFCADCHKVQYCSKECKDWDYVEGGHKNKCEKIE